MLLKLVITTLVKAFDSIFLEHAFRPLDLVVRPKMPYLDDMKLNPKLTKVTSPTYAKMHARPERGRCVRYREKIALEHGHPLSRPVCPPQHEIPASSRFGRRPGRDGVFQKQLAIRPCCVRGLRKRKSEPLHSDLRPYAIGRL